jgi:hypothetical protein
MSIESTSESAIFERVVLAGVPALAPEAARSLLSLAFSPEDAQHMHVLAEKAR